VAVVSNDDGTIGWQLEIYALEIPEFANRDFVEADALSRLLG
jgi:hypothetical protein